jgi:hypothetical protein
MILYTATAGSEIIEGAMFQHRIKIKLTIKLAS